MTNVSLALKHSTMPLSLAIQIITLQFNGSPEMMAQGLPLQSRIFGKPPDLVTILNYADVLVPYYSTRDGTNLVSSQQWHC